MLIGATKELFFFVADSFERAMLRDDCFVAMLALMDRMTVLSTRRCGTSTPRNQEERIVEWLAGVLVISKQSQCEAELNSSPKDIIRKVHKNAHKLWPSIVQAELRIYRALDYRVAVPTALDITIRIASDISAAVRAAERQDPDVCWPGMVEGCLPAPSSELVASTPRFALLAYFLVELAFAHAPADIYGCGASPLALALACLRLSLHAFGEPPLQCEGALEEAQQEAEVNGSVVGKLALRLHELWSHLPNSAVVRKWAARKCELGGPLPLAPSPLNGRWPWLHICEASEVSCAKKEGPAPGAQISEGKGQVKVTCMKRRLSEHASSIGSDEQNLDIPKRLKSSEQCAVPGVSWHSAKSRWQVSWYEEKKRKYKCFHVHHFMKTSKFFCEAKADALHAAIGFRKGLERNGVVKTKRVENPHSGVKGVFWHILDKAWEVKMHINGQTLYGGKFTPKDSTPEEVERARLLIC